MKTITNQFYILIILILFSCNQDPEPINNNGLRDLITNTQKYYGVRLWNDVYNAEYLILDEQNITYNIGYSLNATTSRYLKVNGTYSFENNELIINAKEKTTYSKFWTTSNVPVTEDPLFEEVAYIKRSHVNQLFIDSLNFGDHKGIEAIHEHYFDYDTADIADLDSIYNELIGKEREEIEEDSTENNAEAVIQPIQSALK